MAELDLWPAFCKQCKNSRLAAYVCHVINDIASAVGVPDVHGVAGSPLRKLVVSNSVNK
jgi:hypothetical protein